jgi:hypothetical protein
MNYENMMFVPSEPVPELKPSMEQLERLARALYPIIVEYYSAQEKTDIKSSSQQSSV